MTDNFCCANHDFYYSSYEPIFCKNGYICNPDKSIFSGLDNEICPKNKKNICIWNMKPDKNKLSDLIWLTLLIIFYTSSSLVIYFCHNKNKN